MTKLEKAEPAITIEVIVEEIKKFEKIQSKYREYGANDTEPDGIFQRIIDDAVQGKEPAIPRSGRGWELYANSMNCDEAAAALHDQALKIVQAIEMCPIRELSRLQTKLREYCWRLY